MIFKVKDTVKAGSVLERYPGDEQRFFRFWSRDDVTDPGRSTAGTSAPGVHGPRTAPRGCFRDQRFGAEVLQPDVRAADHLRANYVSSGALWIVFDAARESLGRFKTALAGCA